MRKTLLPVLTASLFFHAGASAFADQDNIAGLRDEIMAAPANAPVVVRQFLRNSGDRGPRLAAPATSAAIECLGPKTDARKISAIVFAAVRAEPDSVLEIVHAAVVAAPKYAAEIAATAASAVPNPWKEVRYHRNAFASTQSVASSAHYVVPSAPAKSVGTEPDFKGEHDFKDAKEVKDAKDATDAINNPYAPADPGDPGDPMPLAQAIALTAFDPGSGISLASIQSAVDLALIGDPSVLMNLVSGPRGISGVGTAGSSNFANEPYIPPKPLPKQPVSR